MNDKYKFFEMLHDYLCKLRTLLNSREADEKLIEKINAFKNREGAITTLRTWKNNFKEQVKEHHIRYGDTHQAIKNILLCLDELNFLKMKIPKAKKEVWREININIPPF
jgi:hypothetical protein